MIPNKRSQPSPTWLFDPTETPTSAVSWNRLHEAFRLCSVRVDLRDAIRAGQFESPLKHRQQMATYRLRNALDVLGLDAERLSRGEP